MKWDNSREITKDFILDKIGEENIFKRYLGLDEIEQGVLILNPLRKDNNPTASFKWVKDRIQFRDWSETFSRDCFNVAQLILRESNFHRALIKIAYDFGLISRNYRGETLELTNIPQNIRDIRKEDSGKLKIQIKIKNYDQSDLDFWKQFGVLRRNLDRFNVYCISHAWLGENNEPFYYYKKGDECYAYYFGNGDYKLYFPKRTKYRFIHNNAKILQGWNELPVSGDFVLITKALKEIMSFSNFDVPATASMAETILLSEANYQLLKSRFKMLFVLNDNDWPGKKATVRLINKFTDIIPLSFPKGEPKDFGDNFRVYGERDMVEQIDHIKKLYGL